MPSCRPPQAESSSGGWTVFAVLLCGLLLAGCKGMGGKGLFDREYPRPTDVTDAQVIERFNRRAGQMSRLWSRLEIELRWRDERGESRFERGEGTLVLADADKLAADIGKAGQTGFWLGANADRYWIVNAQADPRMAYVGRSARFTPEKFALLTDFAMPIAPGDFARLLGLHPVTAPTVAASVPSSQPVGDLFRVDWDTSKAAWVFKQVSDTDGRQWWTWFRQTDGLVERVELHDGEGATVLVAELTHPQRVRTKGLSDSKDWPYLASQVKVRLTRINARMTLSLSDPRGGDEEGRIKDRLFDPAFIIERHFKVDPRRIVDLDQ
ncbi:MAG: hypothetical protein IT442_14425 [Phycisphaeraceae bacterium]|nr:hypothetical protein [Phycisphaeraceae bacterium]